MSEIHTNQFECGCGSVTAIPGDVEHGQQMNCNHCESVYEIHTVEHREGVGKSYHAKLVEDKREGHAS